MTRRTLGIAGAIAVVVALLVPVVAQARHDRTITVRGECCAGQSDKITGDLQGTWAWSDDGFGIFLESMKYDQERGILRFRFKEVFVGTIAGRTGTFTTRSKGIQRVKPGTPLYDFSTFPSVQQGTTGDPAQWLGGSGRAKIVDGTGELAGVSGTLRWHSLEFLGRARYEGKVKLPS